MNNTSVNLNELSTIDRQKAIEVMTIAEFIEYKVSETVKYIEKEGKTRISTCDYSGWCKKTWISISIIESRMRDRGYGVSMRVNHQVQDWDFYLI